MTRPGACSVHPPLSQLLRFGHAQAGLRGEQATLVQSGRDARANLVVKGWKPNLKSTGEL